MRPSAPQWSSPYIIGFAWGLCLSLHSFNSFFIQNFSCEVTLTHSPFFLFYFPEEIAFNGEYSGAVTNSTSSDSFGTKFKQCGSKVPSSQETEKQRLHCSSPGFSRESCLFITFIFSISPLRPLSEWSSEFHWLHFWCKRLRGSWWWLCRWHRCFQGCMESSLCCRSRGCSGSFRLCFQNHFNNFLRAVQAKTCIPGKHLH